MKRPLIRSLKTLPAAALALAAAAPAAHAAGGVIEINQVLAGAGGVTPGDDPGFPVTITQSGSYRLTSNLEIPDANTTAILIAADNVTVNLNGFVVQGPTECTGNPPGSELVCSPVGSGSGITTSGTRRGLRIHGGIIHGAGANGIACQGEGCQIERVTVRHAGNQGIVVGSGGAIRWCHAERVRFTGLIGANGAIIEHSTSVRNGLNGIGTNGAALVINNVAHGNFQTGLAATISNGVMAAFAGNVFTGSGSNETVGGTEIGTNYCGNNTTCP